jgi:hypothetical protein
MSKIIAITISPLSIICSLKRLKNIQISWNNLNKLNKQKILQLKKKKLIVLSSLDQKSKKIILYPAKKYTLIKTNKLQKDKEMILLMLATLFHQ